jgi:hypothetical protein
MADYARSANTLGDALRERSQLRALPVRCGQPHGRHVRYSEHITQSAEHVRLTPTESVRGDVRVSESDHGDPT